jgi:signal transduction histidine kinase
VSELSDAFHVEARRVILLRERLDLVALARKVAEEPDLAGKVRLSAPPDRQVYVQSDPSRLERALANLLSFAASRLEKSPGREEVVVRIAESDGYAELTVPGGARGLPPEEVAVVFGPTAPPSDAAKGAGVGLYVAKGLIEVHGGRLTVEDVPGAPSTFRLTLPLDDSAASGPDTAEGIPQAGGA